VLIRGIKITALAAAALVVAGFSAYVTITFIIKNKNTVVVPDLTNKDVVYTLELLTDLGLNVKVKGSEYSEVTAKHHVIFQEPEPGAEIKAGRDVRIIISKGAERILMPNLRGLSLRQARIILGENDLYPGNITYTHNNRMETDAVITHYPLAGRYIRRGAPCDILVCAGPRPELFKMPNLTGETLDNAAAWIEDAQLTTEHITAVFEKNSSPETILGQKPPAGYPVTDGTGVHLIINRKPDASKNITGPAVQSSGLFFHRVADGFLKRHIRIELNCFGQCIPLLNAFVKPGRRLTYVIPRHQGASVMLYEDDTLIRTEVFE